MNTYTLRFREVDKKTFEQIKNREKTVETRAATEKYRNIKQGDTLLCVCGSKKLEKVVKKTTVFKSIPELLKHHDIKSIMPDISTVEEATKQYYSFPGYREKIEKFGIAAFEL